MKRILHILPLLLLGVLISCQKASQNGYLDGMWQLEETKESNQEAIERKEEKIFLSIQLEMLSLRGSGQKELVGKLNYTATHFRIVDLRLYSDNAQAASLEQIRGYHLSALDTNFEIITLSSSRLVLKSPRETLYFRKY
jgi:hypothetical protein